MQGKLGLDAALARLARKRSTAVRTELPAGLERPATVTADVAQVGTALGAGYVIGLHRLAATGAIPIIGQLTTHELEIHGLLSGIRGVEGRTQQAVGNQAGDGNDGDGGPERDGCLARLGIPVDPDDGDNLKADQNDHGQDEDYANGKCEYR